MERFAAGSTAGAIAQTSIYPMEVDINFFSYITTVYVSCTGIEKHYNYFTRAGSDETQDILDKYDA